MSQPVHSVLFDQNQKNSGYYDTTNAGYPESSGDGLQFYASNYNDPSYMASSYYGASHTTGVAPPSLHQTGSTSSMGTSTMGGGATGDMQYRQPGSFWSAFGTGGFEDEPPLLEEIGINLQHIQAKVSLSFINVILILILIHLDHRVLLSSIHLKKCQKPSWTTRILLGLYSSSFCLGSF
jgi:hypothetical protein